MTPAITGAIGPTVDIAAIVVLLLSIRELMRQSFPRFRLLKGGTIAVEILYGVISLLDLIRNLEVNSGFIEIYSVVGGSLVIWGALFLSFVAYVVNVRPTEDTLRGILRSLFKSRIWPHGIIISGLAVYVSLFTLYLALARPYAAVTVTNFVGERLEAPAFNDEFLVLGAGLLIFFIAYPVQALLVSRTNVDDEAVKRAMVIVPISWTIIGNIFLVSGALLPRLGIDTLPLGFLAIAVTITWSSTTFRSASVSSFFFSPARAPDSPTFPFSSKVRASGSKPLQGTILLEFEPSTDYEMAVNQFAQEQLSNGRPLFVFTRRGSPVIKSLSNMTEVRFFIQAQEHSRAGEVGDAREMIIPQDSLNSILNAAGKVLETETHLAKSFVFDSLSNWILDFGLEGTYKFVKQINALCYDASATALFLVISNVHETRAVTLMESFFSTILVYNKDGLEARKLSV